MTKDVQDAIVILADRVSWMTIGNFAQDAETYLAIRTLNHAIRHLAYPDRDVYPKVRHARKTVPFVKT